MFELAGSRVVNMSIVGIISSQLSVISLLMSSISSKYFQLWIFGIQQETEEVIATERKQLVV